VSDPDDTQPATAVHDTIPAPPPESGERPITLDDDALDEE
jgi:hypothetical protein